MVEFEDKTFRITQISGKLAISGWIAANKPVMRKDAGNEGAGK